MLFSLKTNSQDPKCDQKHFFFQDAKEEEAADGLTAKASYGLTQEHFYTPPNITYYSSDNTWACAKTVFHLMRRANRDGSEGGGKRGEEGGEEEEEEEEEELEEHSE